MKIIVQQDKDNSSTGTLSMGDLRIPCTLGRGGVKPATEKCEGDGATPEGSWPLRKVFYRSDRMAAPQTGLPLFPLLPETGWCEDPAHPDYNCEIKLPHPAVVDHMTREDHLYDIVVVVGYNDAPVVPGKGSAIFIHLARPEWTPTAGCVGLRADDLVQILPKLDLATHLIIKGA